MAWYESPSTNSRGGQSSDDPRPGRRITGPMAAADLARPHAARRHGCCRHSSLTPAITASIRSRTGSSTRRSPSALPGTGLSAAVLHFGIRQRRHWSSRRSIWPRGLSLSTCGWGFSGGSPPRDRRPMGPRARAVPACLARPRVREHQRVHRFGGVAFVSLARCVGVPASHEGDAWAWASVGTSGGVSGARRGWSWRSCSVPSPSHSS